MVELKFQKKASGNFITNIANVLNTFVNDNDEKQVEDRRAAAEAKRIQNIKAAVKEEEERIAAEKAAAELAKKNSLLAQFAALEKSQAQKKTLDAQEKLADAAKQLEAFNKLPQSVKNAYLIIQ